jgi:hypothetical protein
LPRCRAAFEWISMSPLDQIPARAPLRAQSTIGRRSDNRHVRIGQAWLGYKPKRSSSTSFLRGPFGLQIPRSHRDRVPSSTPRRLAAALPESPWRRRHARSWSPHACRGRQWVVAKEPDDRWKVSIRRMPDPFFPGSDSGTLGSELARYVLLQKAQQEPPAGAGARPG